MPGSSSWMPYAPQGVKGFDDDGDDDEAVRRLKPFNRQLERVTSGSMSFWGRLMSITIFQTFTACCTCRGRLFNIGNNYVHC